MLKFLKKLFGMESTVNYAQLVKEGAKIIDVRSPMEYESGHIKGSVNIPLPELSKHIHKFKKEQIIITCCASGMRSASAKSIFQSQNFQQVYNGGGWASLNRKINA
jgi:phage shock protein E